MTILITGASGFVGTNLIQFLSGLDYIIDVLDLGQSVGEDVRNAYHWNDLDSIPFDSYDSIIHLAGLAHDTSNKKKESIYFNVNYGLTKALFLKFQESHAANFFFFSSVKAAADTTNNQILTEETPSAPVGPYAQSKREAEKFILELLNNQPQKFSGKRVYILRPCMIHGPGNKGNMNLLYKVVKSGLPWPLGAYENLRSFVSVKNLNFILGQMIEAELESGIYNIADDTPLSTNRLIELICESRGVTPRIWKLKPALVNGLARFGDFLHLPFNSARLKKLTEDYVVSNSKIKAQLGVKSLPVTSEEGIMLTLDSFMR